MPCKSCKHLGVPLKSGRRRVYPERSYECTAPIPNIVFPASVQEDKSFFWPPRRKLMMPNSGRGCQLFEKYKPVKQR